MKTYRFYLYRDYFMPGTTTSPEETVQTVEDPEIWAKKHCIGNIERIDWVELEEKANA